MGFDTVFTDGVLVDIDVHTWTGERQLKPEDLGLTEKDVSKAFRLGSKTLIPAEIMSQFKHLDYESRKLLTEKGFSFPFGGARFIPKSTMIDFADGMGNLIEKFNAVVEDLISNYDKYKLQMREHYVYAANEAYEKVQSKGYDKTKDEYINEFLSRVDSFYPSAEDIRKRFGMEYHVFQVALPDLSEASYDDIATESQKMRLLEDSYKKSLYRKINEFTENIVKELRAKAETVIRKVRDNIKEEGRVTERTLKMIRRMIQNYESMNIVGDSVLVGQLKEFKTKYLDGVPAVKYRTDKDFRLEIGDALERLLATATDQVAIDTLISNYKQKVQV